MGCRGEGQGQAGQCLGRGGWVGRVWRKQMVCPYREGETRRPACAKKNHAAAGPRADNYQQAGSKAAALSSSAPPCCAFPTRAPIGARLAPPAGHPPSPHLGPPHGVLVEIGGGGDPDVLAPAARIVVYDHPRDLPPLAHARAVTDEEAAACGQGVSGAQVGGGAELQELTGGTACGWCGILAAVTSLCCRPAPQSKTIHQQAMLSPYPSNARHPTPCSEWRAAHACGTHARQRATSRGAWYRHT